ncbi:hypothetical protein [Pseudomonas kuykendallii]|uniref:hypothetical protein n=1 Tax=Pseudomonas kuykendallii TaxID=1007099 RepID=UPI00289A8892|nr:hypothetical protein [Pseudomonas kuykendallii]
MDYIPLLSATVRLLDLHDSDRGYGESPSFTRESRPGKTDGVYLDIAALVIQCLKVQDETAHQEYMPFAAIFRHVSLSIPGVATSDVAYVLNVLRRPTELYYLERAAGALEAARHSEKRKTAIVDKTDYADEYRLSPTGRMLPVLVNAARDATYIRGDAYNLLHAVEFRDFQKVGTFADEIVSQLRNEILDILSALEKVGKTETAEKYVGRFDQYCRVINETIDIVRKAEEEVDKKSTADDFSEWLERSDADITFESVRAHLLRVRQVLIIFNRRVSELVQAAAQNKRIAVPPPSFLDVARELVRAPFSEVQEAHFMRQWGATTLEAPFHSVLDGWHAVPIRQGQPEAKAMEFSDETVESVSQLGKVLFIARYGEEIATFLKKSPLRLSEAIDRGWFLLDGKPSVGDLVGVFVAPDTLPIKEPLEIRVSPTLVTKQVNGGDFLFCDLELAIRSNA